LCFLVSKIEADAQNSRMVMIWSVKRRVCETIVKSFRDLLFFSVSINAQKDVCIRL